MLPLACDAYKRTFAASDRLSTCVGFGLFRRQLFLEKKWQTNDATKPEI